VEHEGLEVVFYRNMGGEKKSIPILKTARQPTKYKYPFKVFSKLSKLPFTNSLVFVSSKLTLTQHPAPPDPKALLGRRPPPPPPRRMYTPVARMSLILCTIVIEIFYMLIFIIFSICLFICL
jgi:hypothetical protein